MYQVKLLLKGKYIKQEHSIKYLGVMIDKNLIWKSRVSFIQCKIKRARWNVVQAKTFCHEKYPSKPLLLTYIPIFNLWYCSLG